MGVGTDIFRFYQVACCLQRLGVNEVYFRREHLNCGLMLYNLVGGHQHSGETSALKRAVAFSSKMLVFTFKTTYLITIT
jgi:hypothetical protein